MDAYDSPTLLSDAQRYSALNDPKHPLSSSQFFNVEPGTVTNEAACGASGWFDEQALDVESSHAMAPGADILYVGAQGCFDTDLLAAVQTAITSGASVVSDSWGDNARRPVRGCRRQDGIRQHLHARGATGVSVLYSSGDDGDNFADTGLAVPDYPPTSPFVTAVGGTSLQVDSGARESDEFGWSTGKQTLCAGVATTNCGTATKPTGCARLECRQRWRNELQLLPAVLPGGRGANRALGAQLGAVRADTAAGRADISMDADAQTGMLIGLTQTFPDGVYYDQFKEGGTSLASPLLAGVIADADQSAGVSLGFLNPASTRRTCGTPAAFNDIVPPANPKRPSTIRVDYANTVDASNGYNVSLRTFDYEGPETYCDGTGNCATRPVTLTTAKGSTA